MTLSRASARAATAAVGIAVVVAACSSDRVGGPTPEVCAAGAFEINGFSEDKLTPGGTVIVNGCGFGALPAANSVTIDGVPVPVASASATELHVPVPLDVFPCEPERTVTVTVTADGATVSRNIPLIAAAQHRLGIGASVTRLLARDVRCNELAARGARYFVSVFNISTSPTSQTSVQLRGTAGPVIPLGAEATSAAPAVIAPSIVARAPRVLSAERLEARRGASRHREMLETNRNIAAQLTSSFANSARRSATGASSPFGSLSMAISAPLLGVGTVGDITPMRVWRRGQSCSDYDEISTRTVYVGTRSIIREDVAAPLAGTMDSYYTALGQEFDQTMFPVLEQNFGNPLVLDQSLDNNGRIIMVFTKRVNDDGLAGFVISCDFFPRDAAPSSNNGEVFYAFVPTDPSSGIPNGVLTKDSWRREIRSTLIHEAKHITSFAERISRNASFEQSWLEEGTAMHSEEIWSRSAYGSMWRGNTGYQTSVYCDVRQATDPVACSTRPLVMLSHFSLLYDYLESVETLSPLGRNGDDDFSFYGSAWAFVRWTIDHHSASDAAFLKPLTQESVLSGLENISARVGKTFPELLGEWSLAMATDDIAGFNPQRAQLTFPSWQTREIYRRLNEDFNGFTADFPLVPRAVPFGAFTRDVTLRGGTAAIFELTGSQTATQLLELRTSAGGPPPGNLRIAIVRVQ
jgi:hypothetical protein